MSTTEGVETRAKIMAAIAAHYAEKGYAPTVRELAETANRAVGTTQRHISILEKHGYLTRMPSSPRTIRLTGKPRRDIFPGVDLGGREDGTG